MVKLFCCIECGNLRELFPEQCEFCGSLEKPISHAMYLKVDLEDGKPKVEEALEHFERYLNRADELSVRALLVLHGYGSSGQGGLIRRRFRELLQQNEWADRVEEFYAGEELSNLKQMRLTSSLKTQLTKEHLVGNPGCTLLLLKSYPLSTIK